MRPGIEKGGGEEQQLITVTSSQECVDSSTDPVANLKMRIGDEVVLRKEVFWGCGRRR